MNTRQLFENYPGLSDDTRAALLSAVSTRGKFKGYLLSDAPRDPARALAWQVVISNLAPARVSVWSLMGSDTAKFNALDSEIKTAGLGNALNIVEPDFRWNLYAHGKNIKGLRADLARALGVDDSPAPIDREKAARVFIAARKRIAKRPDKLVAMRAYGGPFDGYDLTVCKYSDGNTAMLRVGSWYGQYKTNAQDPCERSRLTWFDA